MNLGREGLYKFVILVFTLYFCWNQCYCDSTVGRNMQNPNPSCSFKVSQPSIQKFHRWVKHDGFKYIQFYLNFTRFVNETGNIRMLKRNEWKWIIHHEDVNENSTTFVYPYDFDILSFGILAQYSIRYPEDPSAVIDVEASPENCTFELGTNDSDSLVQAALHSMSKGTTYEEDSLFCYEGVRDVRGEWGEFWWYVTHWFGLEKDYTYTRCCAQPTPEDIGFIALSNENTLTVLLNIYGLLFVLFFPLILNMFPDEETVQNEKPAVKLDPSESSSKLIQVPEAEEEQQTKNEIITMEEREYVSLNDNPFTIGQQTKKLLKLTRMSKKAKRIWRVLVVLMSLVVLEIQMGVYFAIEKQEVLPRLEADVPLGILCVPYGFSQCLNNSKYFLGGPIIYIPLFFFISTIIICLPDNIPQMMLSQTELDTSVIGSFTLLKISTGTLQAENITPKNANKHGYELLTIELRERFLLLFNPNFWNYVHGIIRKRFVDSRTVLQSHCGKSSVTFLLLFVIWFLVGLFCFLELLLMIIYYGLPLFFVTKLFIWGMMSKLWHHPALKNGLMIPLRIFLSLILAACLLFVVVTGIYLYTVSVVFMLKVACFTFIGIVVHPESVIQYVITICAVIYYMYQSYSGVRDDYSVVLENMKEIDKQLKNSTPGENKMKAEPEQDNSKESKIPKAVFQQTINTVRPVRKQIVSAIAKIFALGNVLFFSVHLINDFQDQHQIGLAARSISMFVISSVPSIGGVFKQELSDTNKNKKIKGEIEEIMKQFKN